MSNIQLAIIDPEYKQWISNIEKRFRQQQIKAAVQVNSNKIEFYWSLGRDICEMHVEERWGESVIKQLSEDLRLAIDEAKGLTPGNLYYCKRFYLLYYQLFEKVPQVGEIFKFLHTITEKCLLPLNIFAIPWGHHVAKHRGVGGRDREIIPLNDHNNIPPKTLGIHRERADSLPVRGWADKVYTTRKYLGFTNPQLWEE